MRIAIIRNVIRLCLAVFLAAAAMVSGQSIGTVNLPSTLADAGAQIQDVVPIKPQKIGYCEGPVVDKNGTLYFSEQNAGIVWKVTVSGTISKWLTLSPAYVNGLDFAPSGLMAVCEKNRITERDTNGEMVRIVTSGTTWGQGSNDLSYASNGDLFFTAFNQHFWFHSADSSINHDYHFTQPANINFNGIEYLEEKGILYVCQWGQNRVLKYPVGANRVVDTAAKKTFATINGPDGITVDADYNVYIASNNSATGGIYVYDSSGNQLGSILMRQDNTPSGNASNCVFGGPDNTTLYITGDSGAYKVRLKVAGRVRPNSSGIRRVTYRHNAAFATPMNAPEFVLTRYGTGLQIRLSNTSNATVAFYSLSGIIIDKYFTDTNRPIHWRPPSKGMFVLRISSSDRATSRAVVRQ